MHSHQRNEQTTYWNGGDREWKIITEREREGGGEFAKECLSKLFKLHYAYVPPMPWAQGKKHPYCCNHRRLCLSECVRSRNIQIYTLFALYIFLLWTLISFTTDSSPHIHFCTITVWLLFHMFFVAICRCLPIVIVIVRILLFIFPLFCLSLLFDSCPPPLYLSYFCIYSFSLSSSC